MFSLSEIVPLAGFVLYLGLLIITLAAGHRRPINRAFAVYLLCMMVWSFASFEARAGLVLQDALFWSKVFASAASGLPIFFYQFVRVFLGLKKDAWRLYAGYAIYAISVLITMVTNWAITDAYIEGPKYHLEQGRAMDVITAWGALFMGLAIYRLWRRYKESDDLNYRRRISYPLIGVFFIVVGALFNMIPAFRVYPFDHAANAINAIILAYSILRYQLIYLTPVVRQGVTYSLLTALMGGGYLLSFFALQFLIERFGMVVLAVAFGVAVSVALAFPSLRNRAQLLVDRLLFRRRYAVQRMLQRLSSTATQIIELQSLTQLLLNEVTTTMKIDSACIFLRDALSGEFYIAAAKGLEEACLEIRWRSDHPILRWLDREQKVLSQSEVDLKPEFHSLWGQERADLDRLAAELFIPLRVKGSLIGVFAVGSKFSSAPYTPDDKIALATLANQTAVAIENARLYATEQRRLKESLILLDIAAAVSSTLNLTQVLKIVAQRTAEACEVHRCSIFLLDEQQQRILPLMSQYASGGIDEQLWERFRHKTYMQRIDEVPVIAQLIQERQPLVLDADTINSLPESWVFPFNICSVLIVPLVSRDRVIGAMVLDHVQPGRRFGRERINLAVTIASQISVAIDNARLYQQTIEEKAKTEIILRETFSGIVVVDENLRIVSLNPGAALITGYQEKEVQGKRLDDIFGADIAAPDSPLAKAVTTGQKVPPVETMLSGKQGVKDVLLGVTPLSSVKGSAPQYLLSFTDISKLKEVDRLKSSIVANVSHELRAPLASIKAYTELLLEAIKEPDIALCQEWLSVIDQETERLTALINDFLNLSRLEAGHFELNKVPLHLEEIIADVVALMKVQAERRRISIQVQTQPDLPPLWADEDLIRIVVKNLLSNAIKFSHEGGNIYISVWEENGDIKLYVKDEGIGIPQDAIPHLFTKFFRVPSAAGVQGTGLGLALAKEAVAAHQGHIDVESTLGKGCKFTVTIPRVETPSLDKEVA